MHTPLAESRLVGRTDIEQRVARHYGERRVLEDVLAAVAAAGLDPRRLRPEDLAPVDEFHMRGREATEELAAVMGLEPSMSVLDVGCGLGGAARHLASRVGCRVTGLDLVAEYVQAARHLTECCDLGGLLEFRQGSALSQPFADDSFDAAVTQHAAMNIADKAGLYREIRRVLAPGARLGIYDILAGAAGAPHFPVPWAKTETTSFLASRAEMRALLEDAGFEIESWHDRTDDCLAWFAAIRARHNTSGSRPLGLHLLLGPAFPAMAGNMILNLAQRRIAPAQIVCRA